MIVDEVFLELRFQGTFNPSRSPTPKPHPRHAENPLAWGKSALGKVFVGRATICAAQDVRFARWRASGTVLCVPNRSEDDDEYLNRVLSDRGMWGLVVRQT